MATGNDTHDMMVFLILGQKTLPLNVTFHAKTSTQTFLPGKTPGFPRELTGTHRDVPESFLENGFLFSGFTGKSREVPVTLLEIYRDIAMSSPVCLLYTSPSPRDS